MGKSKDAFSVIMLFQRLAGETRESHIKTSVSETLKIIVLLLNRTKYQNGS